MGNEIHYTLHYEDFEAAEGATTRRISTSGNAASLVASAHFFAAAGDKPPCTPTEGTFDRRHRRR